MQIKAKKNKTIMIIIGNKLEYNMVVSNRKESKSNIDALNILLWRTKFRDIDYRSFFMDSIVQHVVQLKYLHTYKYLIALKIQSKAKCIEDLTVEK